MFLADTSQGFFHNIQTQDVSASMKSPIRGWKIGHKARPNPTNGLQKYSLYLCGPRLKGMANIVSSLLWRGRVVSRRPIAQT